jgi:hypothetical protein
MEGAGACVVRGPAVLGASERGDGRDAVGVLWRGVRAGHAEFER